MTTTVLERMSIHKRNGIREKDTKEKNKQKTKGISLKD